MADVSSMNESDWGPEHLATPPIGSIFIMRLVPTDNEPTVASGGNRFRLLRMRSADEMELESWSKNDNRWYGGHRWNLKNKPTFRLLLTNGQVTYEAKTEAKKSGCHCKKCNIFYPFAEPNQKDGTLVCWSCRTYPFYEGRQ